MGARIRAAAGWLGGRTAAFGAIAALAIFAAVAAWYPGGEGALISATPEFLAVVAALALVLAAGLWRRRGALRRIGTAGPWVLHFGLAAVAVLGAVFAGRWTDDEVRAVVGETVRIPGTVYSVELHSLDPAYRTGSTGWGNAAEVTVYRYAKAVAHGTVFANHPLRVGDRTLWLAIHGYAPTLLVEAPRGRAGAPAALCVGLETTLTPRPYFWRWFQLPGRGGPLLAFYRKGSPLGPSDADALTVVEDRPGGRGAAVTLRPGKPVPLAGLRVALGEVRYWGGFRVRAEPGLRWLFAACWIAVAGAAWSLAAGRPGGLRAAG